jgi:hypothetical protein
MNVGGQPQSNNFERNGFLIMPILKHFTRGHAGTRLAHRDDVAGKDSPS